MDVPVTVAGNLVNDPELRTTQSGLVVTSFRIASTQRRFDRASGEWKDGDSVFLTVSCWRHLARNVAASLRKGDGVVVHGRLVQRNFEKDGARRSVHEIEATAIGPDLNRGVARPERPDRSMRPQQPADGEQQPSDAAEAGTDTTGSPAEPALDPVEPSAA